MLQNKLEYSDFSVIQLNEKLGSLVQARVVSFQYCVEVWCRAGRSVNGQCSSRVAGNNLQFIFKLMLMFTFTH